ncbi:class I SAM-dependent methyltransferase [Candidatus Woesearchaeota archaeon]|nr:class I SAM-dependent methyltransferase [Candidatus Woesearchaeota archaeon]
MESEKRFKGSIGTEYALFEKSYPHFRELQDGVADEISKYTIGRKNVRVLEIGCGPGPTSDRILAKNVGVTLTAIDNEQVMINQARDHLKDYGERVELFERDALDFLKETSDSSFDIVVSAWTLHNFDQDYRKNILREIIRVLKSSGVFVNADKYAQDDEKKHFEDFNWSIKQFIECMGEVGYPKICYEWILHMVLDESKNSLMKEKDSLVQLLELGFLNPRIIWRKRMEAMIIAQKRGMGD